MLVSVEVKAAAAAAERSETERSCSWDNARFAAAAFEEKGVVARDHNLRTRAEQPESYAASDAHAWLRFFRAAVPEQTRTQTMWNRRFPSNAAARPTELSFQILA